MTEYTQQVCFLPLYEGSDEKHRLSEDSYWPCVLFKGKEEFASQQADLLDVIGHNQEIQRDTTNDLLTFRGATPEESGFAYLLGGKKFPSNVARLRWTKFVSKEDTTFEEAYFQAMETSSGIPGFRDALKDALLLVYGPEFSRSRLRFRQLPPEEIEPRGGLGSNQMWPCLLFDDYLQLTAGLRERNLLTSHEEVELSRMFVTLSQSEETRNPPYVYFFGRQHVGHCIDAFDDSLEDFKSNLFDAMMDNMSKKPFMSALFEAMNVVSCDDGRKYFPFTENQEPVPDHEEGDEVYHGSETSMAADMPVFRGALRADFGQKECTRCKDRIVTGQHAKTCVNAPDNWYVPPRPALLAMLTETQYKNLHDATKRRIRTLGLEKHLRFIMGGKRKDNQTPLRHSKRMATASSSISPNETKSS